MDSPGASTEWPTDLVEQVAELNNDPDQTVSHSFADPASLQGIPTATLTEAQIQLFTQAGYNFSFFQLPSTPAATIQTSDTSADNNQQTSDINSLTEAIQQQLQGFSKDITGWPQSSSKLGGTATPSTVILNIDGTQQEIPISFHIEASTPNALNTGADASDSLDAIDKDFEGLEEVANGIKDEQQQHRQQIIQHMPIVNSSSNVATTVKLFSVPSKPAAFLNGDLLQIPVQPDGKEPDNTVINSVLDEKASNEVNHTGSDSNTEKRCTGTENCFITHITGVRKSSRIAKQVQPHVPKAKPVYDPTVEYDTSKMWCEECQCCYDGECPEHILHLVQDKIVLSRAWASLPPILQIFRIADDSHIEEISLGVFTKKFIQKRTKFGPFVAETIADKPISGKMCLAIEGEDGDSVYLDATDESKCNWMMFVRPAETYEEQNLTVFQFQEDIYFITIKDIQSKDELKVWYAPHYAQRLGYALLPRNSPQENEVKGKFECSECSKKLKSAALLQKHITDCHENDANVTVDDDNDAGYTDQNVELPSFKSKRGKSNMASFQSWKKKKRNMYFSKIKKYKELKTKAEAKRKETTQFWTCQHCTLKFDNATLLNIHTLTHAAEAAMSMDDTKNDALAQLSTAAAQISTEAEARRSLAESGVDSTGEIKCPCCEEIFLNTNDLIQHTAVHAKTRRVRRSRSNRVFNPEKPYQCDHCIKTFSSDDRLQRHRLVHSADDSHKPLECNVCHKKFMNNPALACHMKTHSSEKYYSCPICREGFDQMHVLKVHGLTHAVNGVYPCPHCHKTFYDFNSVRKHMRQYHPYKELPCPFCDKVFPRTDKLKLHMLKHSDHKEYMCDQCGRQFKRKDKLKEHAKRMHDPQNPKTLRQYVPGGRPPKEKFTPKVLPTDYHRFIYKCHSCLLGFKRRGMLVNHLAKRHPGVKPDSIPELNLPILRTQRDFFCQYCDKVYKSSSKRKAHIIKSHPGAELPASGRVHGEEYDGVYNNFGINTATYSQLTGSIAANPHPCEYCFKQYASKPKLLQHQRREHPNNAPPKKSQRTFTVRDKNLALSMEKLLDLPDATATVVIQQEGQTADLLTQAMSELTQSFTTEYRSQPQTPQQVTQEYQLNLGNGQSSRSPSNLVIQPTLLQAGATSLDLSQFIQDVNSPDDSASNTQPITIVHGNQTQTITVPLSLATQLISRSFVQNSAIAK